MKQESVGPYVVHELSVSQGLDLMNLVNKDDVDFQKEVLMRCVTLDGKSAADSPFGDMLPYFGKLVEVAFTLNGFRNNGEAGPLGEDSTHTG